MHCTVQSIAGDKLPAILALIIPDRIHSETTWKPNHGKYMFLELLGINSLQTQVTTKDS